MTSAQLKAAFKMMQDFAPAIMKASEILEDVERAETQLQAMEAGTQQIVKDTAALIDVRDARAAEALAVSDDVEKAKVAALAERETLSTSIAVIQREVDAVQSALTDAQRAHAEFMQQADADRRVKQSELDGVQRELDALLAKFIR